MKNPILENAAFKMLFEKQMERLRPLIRKYPDGANQAIEDATRRATHNMVFGKRPGVDGVYEAIRSAGRTFNLKGDPLDPTLVAGLAEELGDSRCVYVSARVAPFIQWAVELNFLTHCESCSIIAGMDAWSCSLVIGIDWSVLEVVEGRVCGFDVERCFIVEGYRSPTRTSPLKS